MATATPKTAETREQFYRRMNQVGIAKAVERKEQATMNSNNYHRMNAKQAYRLTYQMYRLLNDPENTVLFGAMTQQRLNMLHAAQPKMAAAAHTSFSLRGLFNSQ